MRGLPGQDMDRVFVGGGSVATATRRPILKLIPARWEGRVQTYGRGDTPLVRCPAFTRLLLAVSLVVIATTLTLLSCASASDRSLRRDGVQITATVTEKRNAGRLELWIFQYEYAGTTYEKSIQCAVCYTVGEQITVYVDRDDPNRFVTARGGGSRNRLEGAGWVLVFVLLIPLVWSVRSLVRMRAP